MSGLRIRHPELRSSVVLIPVPPKALRGSAKELRIEVDDSGHSLVSEGVWEEIILAKNSGFNSGFIVVNEVASPPKLMVGFDGEPDTGRETYRVEQEALRQIAPVGVNTRVVEHGLKPSV